MANNRDKNLNTPEETEYHFSDEDITYETEPEETEVPPPSTPAKPASSNFLSNVSSRQRIGISIVVFVILLFIVYKIVSPGGQSSANAQLAAVPNAPTTNLTPTTAAPMSPAPVVSTPPAGSGNQLPPAVSTLPAAAPQSVMATMPPPNQGMPNNQPLNSGDNSINQMPAVMPVSGAPPIYPAGSPAVENGANQLTSINNQLVTQMQTDYTQKLTEVAQQNKRLEEDVQKLSTSVATMEARMNQLVQLLITQQRENQQVKEVNMMQSPSAASPKLPYTVQAIIPGRAWLRADNGDTITVTEGDVLKDIGKVSKIDPYDGVIEINTGRKVVSLSYGNGG